MCGEAHRRLKFTLFGQKVDLSRNQRLDADFRALAYNGAYYAPRFHTTSSFLTLARSMGIFYTMLPFAQENYSIRGFELARVVRESHEAIVGGLAEKSEVMGF